jgi:glycosyltransferase involved in cell wall biosynthesis
MIESVRVALFTDCYHEVNGVATTSRKLVQVAGSRGTPLLAVHCGPERTTYSHGSITHLEFRRGWASFAVERDLGFDLLLWRERQRVLEALRKFQPDVVHLAGPGDVGLLGLYLGHSLRIPIVASWHTNLHEYAARRISKLSRWAPTTQVERLSLHILGLFYSVARVTLAPNPEWVAWLAARTGKPSLPMGRGVDSELFNPSRRSVADNVIRIGYVGRVSPEKGVRSLVSIRERLKTAGFDKFRFVVVGDGNELPWLKEHLKDADFTGVLRGEQLAEAYANMDIFAFPSETDTFGNVVQEAMASGVVPVVSSRGGPKYIVEDGISGFVASDEGKFASHIGTLMGSPEILQRMRSAARKKAEAASWDRVFEEVYEAYEQAVHGPGGNSIRLVGGRRVPEPA